MSDLIALFTLIVWPVIPLFWIPVHGLPGVFKRLGLFTYVMPVLTWVPLAVLLYLQREFLLSFKIAMPFVAVIAGWLLLAAGTALHLWTGNLLSLPGIIGVPEVSDRMIGGLVTKGAFSVVRHPTYLAHTIMFLGVFLLSGVAAVGAVALLDFAVVNLFVIPLEERELMKRFGEDYRTYREKTPRFFPRLFAK